MKDRDDSGEGGKKRRPVARSRRGRWTAKGTKRIVYL